MKFSQKYKVPEFDSIEEEMAWKQANYHADEFRTRADRIQHMNLHQTDDSRIVIPPNKGGYGFEIDLENFEAFGNRLDPEIAIKTVKQASKLIGKEYSKMKREEVIDHHKWSYIFLKLALGLVLVGFSIFQMPVYVNIEGSENMIFGGFVFLLLALLITIGVIVRTLMMKRTKINIDEHIQAELEKFIEKENTSFYNEHGIDIYVGPRYYWLEFRLMD